MAFIEKTGQGGLWKAETQDGVKYYRGKVEMSLEEFKALEGTETVTLAVSVFVPDEKTNPKAPDLKVYLKRWKNRQGPGKSRFLDEPPAGDEDIPF